jgi:hypothetical protein
MNRLPISLLAFVIVALLIGLPARAAKAAGSLYDPKEAQALSAAQLSLFGPNSKNYRYDKRMIHAAEIAAERARKRPTFSCWRYVKQALLAAKTIDSYPKTATAREAGRELETGYGFKKIRISNPYKAPLGSVLVYGGRGAGHVEIRTQEGFVSDFVSLKPSSRPLIGVYVKPKA